MIVVMAWRSLWRHRRRTSLMIAAIVFACGILQFFSALQESSYRTSIETSTQLFQGHAQIQRKGYFDKPQIRNSIPKVSTLEHAIREVGAVRAVSPRSYGFALASSDDRTYGVQVIGVKPETERTVSVIPERVEAGRYFSKDDEVGALIGTLLAKRLRVKVGDELTLLGSGRDGSMAAAIVPILGIYRVGSRALDRGMVHLPLGTFSDIFSMYSHAHAIVIRGDGPGVLDELQRELSPLVSEDLEILGWDELLPGIQQGIELDRISGLIFFICLVAIVGVSILNSTLMTVLERVKEFGVILALGARSERIAMLIFCEVCLMGIIGLIGGVVLGSIVTLYFGAVGLAIPGAAEFGELWNLPSVLYPEVSFFSTLQAVSVVAVTVLLSAIYPVYWGYRLTAIGALRS